MPRSRISENRDFRDFGLNLQTRSGMSIFLFYASIWLPTCGKNLIVMSFLVFVISGDLPDAIKLAEMADVINH